MVFIEGAIYGALLGFFLGWAWSVLNKKATNSQRNPNPARARHIASYPERASLKNE